MTSSSLSHLTLYPALTELGHTGLLATGDQAHHHITSDHGETRRPSIAYCQTSDEDIIAGLYVRYNGPHFYCWSGSRAQLKVNRSGLTRDDQAQAGPGHSSGRSESLTGLGVSSGWAGHLVPVWTNQRPDTRVTGQSEARLHPKSGPHQTRGPGVDISKYLF